MISPMANRPQAAGLKAYASKVEFRVLGPVQALHGGATLTLGGPKQRTVLALLVASAGTPVPVGRLIEGLYGGEAASGAKRTIHTYVSNLRAQVGDSISRSGDGYRLTADAIDAVEFERLYRDARDLLADDPARAGSLLREALALWRGHAYADVEDRWILSGEISRLEELRLAALEARIEADLSVGHHHELIGELEALTEEYPLRETLRSQHMLALYRSGRQSEALRAFGRTRTMLSEELGRTAEEAAPRGAVVDRRRPWISSDGSWISSLDAGTGDAYVADLDSGATLAEYDRCETVTSSDHAYGLVVVRAEPDCPSGHTSRVETLGGDVLLDFGRDPSMTPRFAAFGSPGTPSEGLLAISHDYITMSFYDTSDGRLLGAFESGAVFVPIFSRDGTQFVAGTQLPEFVAIDIGAFRQTGDLDEAMRIVPAGERPAQFVTIGSRYVVATQVGEEVQVFLADTWQPWFSVSTNTTNTAIAFVTVDDGYAYYEDGDGVMRRIVLDVEELTELARSSVTRDFTVDECERFLYDADCSVYAEE